MRICTLSSSFISGTASLNIVLKNININVEIRIQYYFRPLTMAKVLYSCDNRAASDAVENAD